MRKWLGLAVLIGVAACDGVTDPPPGTVSFSAVVAGGSHSCGLAPGGAAFCWGRGAEGQLGSPGPSTAQPRAVGSDRIFTDIVAGQFHTCALDAEGRASCWGWNHFGQLGDGTQHTSPVPVTTAEPLRFARLAAGWQHTCGVTLNGEGWCWGLNAHGQLGDGTREDSAEPVPVALGAALVSIAVGGMHTCAVTADGRALCWGANTAGQLGDGSFQSALEPVEVAAIGFASIDAGFSHTCALTTGGQALCWGSNIHGELGNTTREVPGVPGRNLPDAVYTGSLHGVHGFESIRAGYHQTCGVAVNGGAYCWGSGRWGQTGNGTLVDPIVPMRVSMATNTRFLAVSTGAGAHSCGLTQRGAAYCWGTSAEGALGVRGVAFATQPLRVGIR